MAGDRSACVGILCRWLSSGAMSVEKLRTLSPPGIESDDDIHLAWLELVMEAEKFGYSGINYKEVFLLVHCMF